MTDLLTLIPPIHPDLPPFVLEGWVLIMYTVLVAVLVGWLADRATQRHRRQRAATLKELEKRFLKPAGAGR